MKTPLFYGMPRYLIAHENALMGKPAKQYISPAARELLRDQVWACLGEGMTYEAIAQKTGISPLNVYNHVSRIRNILRCETGINNWPNEKLIAFAKEHKTLPGREASHE